MTTREPRIAIIALFTCSTETAAVGTYELPPKYKQAKWK